MTQISKPHLAKCGPTAWLCTNSRKEKHIMRGVAAPTPREAYDRWLALLKIVPIRLLLIENN